MAKTPKATEAPAGSIRITSKRAGFRRCGVEHPNVPVDHPAGTFTEAQIETMEAEPMLIVVRLDNEPAGKAEG